MAQTFDLERKKRFQDAIKYLKVKGIIAGKQTRAQIAKKLERHPSNISSAMSGDARYLNGKFIQDFCTQFGGVISAEWIMNGEGEMLTGLKAERMQNITDESLQSCSREELIFVIKQLISLHHEQTEMYRLLIKQNEDMIRNSQDRFNNITTLLYNNV